RLGSVSGSAAHARASVRDRGAGAAAPAPPRDVLPAAAGASRDCALERLRRRPCPGRRRLLVRFPRAPPDHRGAAGVRGLLPGRRARDAGLGAAAQLEPAEAGAAGRAADPAIGDPVASRGFAGRARREDFTPARLAVRVCTDGVAAEWTLM